MAEPEEPTLPRIAILWDEFPAYVAACVRALVARDGCDAIVVRRSYAAEKPFDDAGRACGVPIHEIAMGDSVRTQWASLRPILDEFQPEALVVSGWDTRAYARAAKWMHRRDGLVICTSDNPWRGDFKHVLGSFFARPLFRRRYDAMFVPGERARPLAQALGFHGRRLFVGCYSADWDTFAKAYEKRQQAHARAWPHVFLYAGNLIERKGLLELLAAYRGYREATEDPWPLWAIGEGPLRSALEGAEGVRVLGFLQPADCAEVMADAGAFVLPSRREPWGVVLHEAMAAGLPVLCSDACGAAADLLSDGYSGFLFERGNGSNLREALIRISRMPHDALQRMGRNSFELSKQLTPAIWADRLLRKLTELAEPQE